MPNWCTNRLEVTGTPERVSAFTKAVYENREQVLSFEKLLPTPDPEVALEESKDCYMRDKYVQPVPEDGWYYWRLQRWGTKWNCSEAQVVSKEPGRVVYSFDTAWSPPSEWVSAVSSMYEDLVFYMEYYELGADFAGIAQYKNSICKEESGPANNILFSFVPAFDAETDEELDNSIRAQVERELFQDGVIEDPDVDGGLLG